MIYLSIYYFNILIAIFIIGIFIDQLGKPFQRIFFYFVYYTEKNTFTHLHILSFNENL